VVSVDGINVVTGETARLRKAAMSSIAGDPFDCGWRKSLNRSPPFLHRPGDSTRRAPPTTSGVIGVALFRRKPEPASQIDEPLARAEADAGAAQATRAPRAAQKSLGTGHGRSQTCPRVMSSSSAIPMRPSKIASITTRIRPVGARRHSRAKEMAGAVSGGFVPDPPGAAEAAVGRDAPAGRIGLHCDS
jgi:hypothetical protein